MFDSDFKWFKGLYYYDHTKIKCSSIMFGCFHCRPLGYFTFIICQSKKAICMSNSSSYSYFFFYFFKDYWLLSVLDFYKSESALWMNLSVVPRLFGQQERRGGASIAPLLLWGWDCSFCFKQFYWSQFLWHNRIFLKIKTYQGGTFNSSS